MPYYINISFYILYTYSARARTNPPIMTKLPVTALPAAAPVFTVDTTDAEADDVELVLPVVVGVIAWVW